MCMRDLKLQINLKISHLSWVWLWYEFVLGDIIKLGDTLDL